MARTEQEVNRLQTPVKRYLTFNGKEGKLSERNEDGSWTSFDKMTFVVIDAQCFRVKGAKTLADNAPTFNSNMASSTYPNLVVKFDGEMVATGKWGDIKDKAQGGNPLHPLYKAKYTQLIFALADLNTGAGKEIVQISIHGKSYSSWIDFCKEHNPEKTDIAVKYDGCALTKSTATGLESYVPVWKAVPVSSETIASVSKICDEVFIPWRDAYFGIDLTSTAGSPDMSAANSDNEAPPVKEEPKPKPKTEPVQEVPADDDLPF